MNRNSKIYKRYYLFYHKGLLITLYLSAYMNILRFLLIFCVVTIFSLRASDDSTSQEMRNQCILCEKVLQVQDPIITIEHLDPFVPSCKFHKQCLFSFLLMHDLYKKNELLCPCGNSIIPSQITRLRNSFVAEAYGMGTIVENPTQNEQHMLNDRWNELVNLVQGSEIETDGSPLYNRHFKSSETDGFQLEENDGKAEDNHIGVVLGSSIMLLIASAVTISAISSVI